MDVLGAFPSRPLSVNRLGASRATGWSAVLIGVVLAGVVWWWQAEDLWRDYRISQHYEVASDAEISNARCQTYKAILTDCAATITTADGAQSRVSMTFVDFLAGDYETGVVRSLDDPKLLTLQLGVENMTDRVLTFLGFLGLFVALAFGGLVMALRTGALKRAVAVPSTMKPVIVDVLGLTRTWLNTTVKYRYSLDGKIRKAAGILGKNESPFFLDTGKSKALAVIPAAISAPILLDDQLEMLDLTAQERAAIRGVVSPPSGVDIAFDRSYRW
jgi:hypothetical protein